MRKQGLLLKKTSSKEYFRNTREMLLHTLHHGSISIHVQDFRCECRNLILYDGMSQGLFCASRRHAFTRDLLDTWMFDVCGVGMSFRDSFSSWKRKSCSHSASSIWAQQKPIVKRRMGNVRFNPFLKTVRFYNTSDLHELFSCRTCKVDDGDGVER